MPFTATPARIRRVIRETEFARYTSASMLVDHPTAKDGWANPQESFWDIAADAQVIVNERAGVLCVSRRREAVETAQPFRLGYDIALTPALPRARLIDQRSEFDRTMMIRGVAIDLHVDRNAIEVIG